MVIAQEKDLEDILRYLYQNIGSCIYSYIDIKKYGLEHPAMQVWIDRKDTELICVIMKYYDSINIYANTDEWNYEEVIKLIREKQVAMVSGKRETIELLMQGCVDLYQLTCGYVFQFEMYREFEEVKMVETARIEDLEEIAKLLCEDDEVNSYCKVNDLKKQFQERIETAMGRNYIIKENNKIVGHIATYAEYAKIAVTSGLIVKPEYRNKAYGSILESFLVNKLLKENFRVFTFVTSRKRAKLLSVIGGKQYGEYGKMILNI